MNIPRNDMRQAMHKIECKQGKAMHAVPYTCRKDENICQCRALAQRKVVHYAASENDFISIGHSAYVKTIDHPDVSNTKYVVTTRVLSYDRDSGVFVTENTVYKPV